MSSFRWSWALVAIAFVGTACLDLTPTVIGVAEGGHDGASEEAQTACRECVLAAHEPGPGCGDEFAACALNDTCARIIACSFDDLCYGSTIKSYLACSAPCQSLLPAVDDPAVPFLLSFYNCATSGSCAAACFPGESKGDAGTASNPPLSDAGAGASGDASAEGSTAGSCTNSADQTILAPGIGQAPTECATSCFGNPDTNCNSACIAKSTHLSPACSSCWGALLNCNVASCLAQCLSGQSDACTQCGAQNCQPAFKACSGS